MLDREAIQFDAKDEPLRDDVRLLGELVGDVIREQGGEALFERVEKARQLAIARRQGEDDAAAGLAELLTSLDPFDAREVVRAFSTYFQMVNLAERVHRIRRRRAYENDPDKIQPEGLQDALLKLREAGVDDELIRARLAAMTIEPVFTAHPTEAMRRTLLGKQQQISRSLIKRFIEKRTPREEQAALAGLRREITTTWQTEEHPSTRLTVANERENILFYLGDVIYRIAPVYLETVEQALGTTAVGTHSLPGQLLHFGSWVGGDMDGNPNVTADTVRDSLTDHRALIIHRYKRELGELYRVLSQSVSRVGVDPEIHSRIREYAADFPVEYESLNHRHRNMPYRVLIRLMSARLRATGSDRAGRYAKAADLEADLALIIRSLEAHRGERAGVFQVRRLLRRVQIFGFHLAALDVRQDSLVFRRAVGSLLNEPEWLELSREVRLKRLQEAWRDGGAAVVDAEDEAAETLRVFRTIADCRERFGKAAMGDVIISMAEGADDVLSILQLSRWAGCANEQGEVELDVVPLFETVDDLERAPKVMRELFADPIYSEHLARRGEQRVMLGYSDSSKDSGIASSRWALQTAQSQLAEIARDAGIRLTFFHGRGGTVSRGGGRVHRAVLAAPPGTINGRLRITEQGEIINAKYGLRGIAMRTLEQMLGASLLAELDPQRSHEQEPDWADAMARLAADSRRVFRGLVHENEQFYDFFRKVTPIDVIEKMKIGSRPAARRKGKGIVDLRAIPWVFSWTQNRCLLPGWFGIGTGLEQLIEERGIDFVRQMAREWRFFSNLLDDAEMVLAKTDMAIAQRYFDTAPEHADIAKVITAEFERLLRLLREIQGEDGELLADDPALERSIRLRNPYVDPVSLLQLDLLQRWREAGSKDDELLNALFATINGIAAGLQNTG
ncbi:MAG: phosphoenolpyruvate carboxylase [Gammaproteobacteria bacterium]|nr:phosphoenolpyruvate carboxylase [Gammaproteobacteria bacterium]